MNLLNYPYPLILAFAARLVTDSLPSPSKGGGKELCQPALCVPAPMKHLPTS